MNCSITSRSSLKKPSHKTLSLSITQSFPPSHPHSFNQIRDFKRLINFKCLSDNNHSKQYFLLRYCIGADLKLILQNMLIFGNVERVMGFFHQDFFQVNLFNDSPKFVTRFLHSRMKCA